MFGVTGLHAQQLFSSQEAAGKMLRARFRYGAWALLWIGVHAAGGGTLGALLGWFGSVLPSKGQAAGLLVLSVGCLGWGLHHLGVCRLPMPQIPRQVARPWMVSLPWSLVALGYGTQLGCGIATRVPT